MKMNFIGCLRKSFKSFNHISLAKRSLSALLAVILFCMSFATIECKTGNIAHAEENTEISMDGTDAASIDAAVAAAPYNAELLDPQQPRVIERTVVDTDAGDASSDSVERQLIQSNKEAMTERAFWDSCSSSYWRSQLTPAEQAFYDELYEELMSILMGTQDLPVEVSGDDVYSYTPDVIYADASVSKESVAKIGELFLYNVPQFFFISNGYYLQSFYSDTVRHGIQFTCYPAFANGLTRRQTATSMRSIVQQYLNLTAGDTSAVEKARTLHDALAANMTYGREAYDQSVYASFFRHKGVCAAYSEAYAMLCNAAGVNCLAITSATHEWNQVQLNDGYWYAVDLTWDDQDEFILDTYFCVSDAALQDGSTTHQPSALWEALNRPPCLYNYAERYAVACIHSWDSGTITKAATRSSEGTIVYTCMICGETRTATLAKLSEAVPMYRLYYPGTHEHFYTADTYERYVLITQSGWQDEGIGWYAPASGDPVYRLFNPYTTDHHYTKDLNEYMVLGANGWQQEGIGWYSDTGKTVPVYRFFTPLLQVGCHHYTLDAYEGSIIVTQGWEAEGIGWYGVNP